MRCFSRTSFAVISWSVSNPLVRSLMCLTIAAGYSLYAVSVSVIHRPKTIAAHNVRTWFRSDFVVGFKSAGTQPHVLDDRRRVQLVRGERIRDPPPENDRRPQRQNLVPI